MCWKEKIQWQSVANGFRKEHVLRPPFLDKVLHHFFFLMVICNSLLLLKSLPINIINCIKFYVNCSALTVGKQTHDLTVIASDSKTTQSGGDNRKKFPLGAALQVPQNFSFTPL